MPLYHCCLAWLEPSSVIRPGNYGRVIELSREQHPHWERELILDVIRFNEFPGKPSRMKSAFALGDLEAARFYHHHQCQTSLIYEVEPVDPLAAQHVGDFNCIQPIPGKIDDMTEVARRYWQGTDWFDIEDHPELKCAEVVMETGLRIIGEVSD